MEQTAQPNFNKFAIPVRMGFIITLLKVIINTIGYQFFTGKWGMSMLFMFVSLTIIFVLLVQTGKMQRKAMGGSIDIKQAFQAIFVAALIVCVISSIYDVIYIYYIDPDMMDKIKESSIATAEKWGAPQFLGTEITCLWAGGRMGGWSMRRRGMGRRGGSSLTRWVRRVWLARRKPTATIERLRNTM